MAEQGNWTLVHSAASTHEAEIVKGRLAEHGIVVVLMNKSASVYPSLSEVGVYVEHDHVLRALHLVRDPEAT